MSLSKEKAAAVIIAIQEFIASVKEENNNDILNDIKLRAAVCTIASRVMFSGMTKVDEITFVAEQPEDSEYTVNPSVRGADLISKDKNSYYELKTVSYSARGQNNINWIIPRIPKGELTDAQKTRYKTMVTAGIKLKMGGPNGGLIVNVRSRVKGKLNEYKFHHTFLLELLHRKIDTGTIPRSGNFNPGGMYCNKCKELPGAKRLHDLSAEFLTDPAKFTDEFWNETVIPKQGKHVCSLKK